MGLVLYRKYRSKALDEIVGQEHITKTLKEAIKSDRISHAYLFTGPRGVGKTSIARILAHEVNNLPYEDNKPHIDIIEIDAASNRRIDEIRDLRDKVNILPSSAKYKVYIIDEVHMLTKEAFNALLKTLEEPPAHVIFILATTDPHKLPDTIISRTQRFSFKPIETKQAVDHLKYIADKEKIKVTDGALELIAKHGDGSFRDSISLLDQLGSTTTEITEDEVMRILGIPPNVVIDKIINLLDNPSTSYKDMATEVNRLIEQGYSSSILAKRIMNELRDRLIEDKLKSSPAKVMTLLNELLQVDASLDPNLKLLFTLLNYMDVKYVSSERASEQPSYVEPEAPAYEEQPEPEIEQPIKPVSNSNLKDIWPDVLSELKTRYNTLYGIVRMAQPVFKANNELDLIFDFAFHKKQVSQAKNMHVIKDVIKQLTGADYMIECFLNESPKKVGPDPKTKNLENISKIFGGGELVD